MEQEEIQKMWQEFDKKLDKSIQLNINQLEKINLDKTQSQLRKFLRTPLYGLAIGLVLQVFLVGFMVNHMTVVAFIAPAILISCFVLLQIIFSIYQASTIVNLSYDTPIIAIQKVLARLSIKRIRYLLVTRFAYPLLWVPVLAICSKAFFDLNLYLHLEQWWILLMISIGLLFFIFGIWLSKEYGAQNIKSKWLNKLMANIAKNDITGKNLIVAISFLNTIENFEETA